MVAGATAIMLVTVSLLAPPARADDQAARERYCPSAQPTVTAFHAELNAGAAKDMTRLGDKAEDAARVLISCANNNTTLMVIDRDRLRMRAADALFIAAVARYRTGQTRREVTDLNRVLRLVADLGPVALTSNEHLYQEARILQRYSERILGKPQP
jgi:hypothetical protein